MGGGFAGVAAAVSAARGGARVLLVEKAGCLGEAAGAAMSLAVQQKGTVRDVDVARLQALLKSRGAYLGI